MTDAMPDPPLEPEIDAFGRTILRAGNVIKVLKEAPPSEEES